jgi:hypothetical protein
VSDALHAVVLLAAGLLGFGLSRRDMLMALRAGSATPPLAFFASSDMLPIRLFAPACDPFLPDSE